MNPTNLYHLIWTLLTPDMIFASLLQNQEKQIKKNQISNRELQLGAPGQYAHGTDSGDSQVNRSHATEEQRQGMALTGDNSLTAKSPRRGHHH